MTQREITDPGSIKTQIVVLHSMLQQHIDSNDQAHNRIKDALNSVLSVLNGNGKPGLCSRMHVLESKTAGLIFIAGIVVTTLVAWIVKGWVGD